MFKPVQLGGQKVASPFGGIVLDVVQDHGLKSPDDMYGKHRKSAVISRARFDAWMRLERSGMNRSDIAAMFGVDKSAVTHAMKRAKVTGHKTQLNECPCCGRPWVPALGRG